MSKIVNRLGLLVLDEFFKNLDNDRLEEVLEILKTMNVGCIMLTSHAESIPAFNNKTYILSLNENGLSDII
jgi:DNA repair exonuclease SbcCD ATPase subunit